MQQPKEEDVDYDAAIDYAVESYHGLQEANKPEWKKQVDQAKSYEEVLSVVKAAKKKELLDKRSKNKKKRSEPTKRVLDFIKRHKSMEEGIQGSLSIMGDSAPSRRFMERMIKLQREMNKRIEEDDILKDYWPKES